MLHLTGVKKKLLPKHLNRYIDDIFRDTAKKTAGLSQLIMIV